LHTLFYTCLALLAFAGNSILCRYALTDDVIDAGSFTAIRLLSGALFLMVLFTIKTRKPLPWRSGSWLTGFYLFLYALTFSFAYLSLNTGVGALILFGSVQVTMVLLSILSGKMLSKLEWGGLLIAFSGLSYLLLPNADESAMSLSGFGLMVVSGVAWGLYTVAGKGAADPLRQTGGNFIRTIPFVLLLMGVTLDFAALNAQGVMLAIISGAITSGLGYALWYIALAGLSVTQAAVVQLSVPIIAAFGGIVLLSEAITTPLIIASLLVLGGILVSSLAKKSS